MNQRLGSHRDLNKIIRNSQGDTPTVQRIVQELVYKSPWAIIRVPEAQAYLAARERSQAALHILNSSDSQWIRHTHNLRHIVPDDELRDRVLQLYRTSPWLVQINSGNIKDLFPSEFFQRMLDECGRFLDQAYFELFLLFNAHHDLQSYRGELRSELERLAGDPASIDVDLFGFREPGFACGGMERNYLEAAKTGNGVCLVNNALLAKYFHRKGDARKVSYLPIKTYATNNGYILWKDYFYSPSQKQHEVVIQAIEEGRRAIHIDRLALKSVRPANGIKSEDIAAQLPSEFTENFL